jgi:hypothetical protein
LVEFFCKWGSVSPLPSGRTWVCVIRRRWHPCHDRPGRQLAGPIGCWSCCPIRPRLVPAARVAACDDQSFRRPQGACPSVRKHRLWSIRHIRKLRHRQPRALSDRLGAIAAATAAAPPDSAPLVRRLARGIFYVGGALPLDSTPCRLQATSAVCQCCRGSACLPLRPVSAGKHEAVATRPRTRTQEEAHGSQRRGCIGNGGQRWTRAAHLSRAGEGRNTCRRHVCAESRSGGGRRAGTDIALSDHNAAAFACDITDGAAVEGLIGDVTRRFGRSVQHLNSVP